MFHPTMCVELKMSSMAAVVSSIAAESIKKGYLIT